MLHKEIPFLRIGLPLCAGIITGLYYKPDILFLVVAAFVIITGFIISLFFNRFNNNLVFGCVLTFSMFICGLWLYTNEKSSLSILKPSESVFTCTLSDYPEERENSFRFIVRLNSIVEDGRNIPVKGAMLIYNKKDIIPTSFVPGDILVIRCSPVAIENRGNPYEFDYKFFMENQGIRYNAFTNSDAIIKHIAPRHRSIVHKALITRDKLIGMFRDRGITGERLALVAAITLGQKSMLDPEQKMNFMKAGVMHVMAVSGLHAIIISMFVLTVLFFMKRKMNIIRIITAILILWAFAFVTGLTPSVLRATIMFTFLQAGKLMNRPSNGINSVLASAFLLILIQPSVIFNAGFLLSYAAVIYIIMFYQDFYLNLHFKNWFADKIWQSAAVTIVAQLGTLPLTMLLFNRFPVYFLLANITIVPVTNLLIITGCLVPLFFRIRFLSFFIAKILNSLTGITELMTSKVASLPYSNIENIGLTVPESILLSAVIFLFLFYFLKKKSIRLVYPLIFTGLFVIAGFIRTVASARTNELIVYNTPGCHNIGIKTGRTMNLYSDTSIVMPDVSRHCASLGLNLKQVMLDKDYYILTTGTNKILITKSLNNEIIKKINPDIIIFTGTRSEAMHPTADRRLFIISSTWKNVIRYNVNPGKANPDSIYNIRNSGAFIKRI